jgi:hypothetical protein
VSAKINKLRARASAKMNLRHLAHTLFLGCASIVIIPIGLMLIMVAMAAYFSTLMLPLFMLIESMNPNVNKVSEDIINTFMYVMLGQQWHDWSIHHMFMQFLITSALAIGCLTAVMAPFIFCYHFTRPNDKKLKDQ